MQNFQELAVWQRAHSLVLAIYSVTKDFPQAESFGLVLNLRRSAMFIAARIAEGCGKATDAEFAVELKRARATTYELEYFLLVARDLGLLRSEVHEQRSDDLVEVRKMISGLLKRLITAP